MAFNNVQVVEFLSDSLTIIRKQGTSCIKYLHIAQPVLSYVSSLVTLEPVNLKTCK
jgi:hypothetical protein